MHPFVVTVVGDDGVIADGARLGQNGAVGRHAGFDPAHVATDDVIDDARGIGAAHEHLFQRRHVEQTGCLADRVVFIVGVAVVTPGRTHAVPVFEVRSQCPVTFGQGRGSRRFAHVVRAPAELAIV